MRRSTSRFLVGLFAAPLLLASSVALADNPCGNILLPATASNCQYVVTGGCSAQCTPPSFVAACDGKCDVTAEASCTGGCEATCMGSCTPGSIDCEGSCTSSCNLSCMSSCSDSACQDDCDADCTNRCQVACDVKPPSCDESCKVACGASCTVQANIDCHVSCTASIEGGCTAACQTPQGALFCDGQYVDLTDNSEACTKYLESGGFLQVTATCTGTNCSVALGSCSAGPAVGTPSDRLGLGALAAVMMGLGLVVARRRRVG